MKIKKILVPVDFSRHSLRALDYAIDFARPFDAEITMLHVVEPVAYATPADLYAGMATQLGNLLDELAGKYSARGVAIQAHLRDGVAYREIVDAAKQMGADVIVQATHGRTGLAHVLLGSVAERVVRTAECAVLTIRTTGSKKGASSAKKAAKKKRAAATKKR